MVDGTGAAARQGGRGHRGRTCRGHRRRTRAVGATPVIDASGMLVTPGFVDLHTHYDAQLFVGPQRQPVPAARCDDGAGWELRLLAGAARSRARRLHLAHDGPGRGDATGRARRPDSPGTGPRSGSGSVDFDGRIAVNAGFLVGHSTLRRLVMGERAVGGAASAGGRRGHGGGAARRARRGRPWLLDLAGAHAQRRGRRSRCPRAPPAGEEIERLAAAVRDHEGTTVELIVAGCLNGFTEDDIDF